MSIRKGLYGGAFDPPHRGHLGAAQSFLASGFIDQLLIVPARVSPLKDRPAAPFEDRLAMCRIQFGALKGVEISAIEGLMPEPSYTAHTLARLKQMEPGVEWFLCMGADSLAGLPRWFAFDTLVAGHQVLAVARPGSPEPDSIDIPGARITFVPHVPIGLASSTIRQADPLADEGLLPEIRAYIAEKQLYGVSD